MYPEASKTAGSLGEHEVGHWDEPGPDSAPQSLGCKDAAKEGPEASIVSPKAHWRPLCGLDNENTSAQRVSYIQILPSLRPSDRMGLITSWMQKRYASIQIAKRRVGFSSLCLRLSWKWDGRWGGNRAMSEHLPTAFLCFLQAFSAGHRGRQKGDWPEKQSWRVCIRPGPRGHWWTLSGGPGGRTDASAGLAFLSLQPQPTDTPWTPVSCSFVKLWGNTWSEHLWCFPNSKTA